MWFANYAQQQHAMPDQDGSSRFMTDRAAEIKYCATGLIRYFSTMFKSVCLCMQRTSLPAMQ